MLQIKDLTITHRKDFRIILEKFNLTLNDKDKAVIIGEEGNGKSTLMKWIYDPSMAEEYTECEGELITSGEVLGYLPQELPDADKDKTLYEYFSEANLFFDKDPKELAELAKEFRIPVDFFYSDQNMGSLSGGEKAKVLLLKMSLSDANVLILDEPTRNFSPLSGPVIRKMISLFPGAVISISHDRKYIDEVCTKVYTLTENGLE